MTYSVALLSAADSLLFLSTYPLGLVSFVVLELPNGPGDKMRQLWLRAPEPATEC